MRVLLAEDDIITRFIVTEMLEEIGCEADGCENGYEALRRIEAESAVYRLVLMDVRMPHLTGDVAVRKIRETETRLAAPLTVVAMTADPYWYDTERCEQAGFNAFLRKPVTLSNLSELLEQVA